MEKYVQILFVLVVSQKRETMTTVVHAHVTSEADLTFDPPLQDLMAFALLDCELPITYDVFRSAQLSFVTSTGANVRLRIPDGNYAHVTRLSEALNAALLSQGLQSEFVVDVREAHPRFELVLRGLNGPFAGLRFDSLYGRTPMQIRDLAPAALVMERAMIPMLHGSVVLLLRARELGQACHDLHFVSAGERGGSTAVARVQQRSPLGAWLFYTCPCHGDPLAAVNGPARLSRVRFSWTFPDSEEPLDFHGHPWSMRVKLHVRPPGRVQGGMCIPS
jgi:hypothetical protein